MVVRGVVPPPEFTGRYTIGESAITENFLPTTSAETRTVHLDSHLLSIHAFR